jgi:cell wall-associated NlpC family hydrolase
MLTDHLLPTRLYADLVGKPFVEGGRGPYGYDCVGLATVIQRRRGFDVPDFLSSEAELHRQIAAGGFIADCKRMGEPEPGCVALIKMGAQEHHLGVMVSRYRMIHTTAQTKGVVIESILGPLWMRRILGFFVIEVPA